MRCELCGRAKMESKKGEVSLLCANRCHREGEWREIKGEVVEANWNSGTKFLNVMAA